MSKKSTPLALAALALVILLTGCGGGDDPEIQDPILIVDPVEPTQSPQEIVRFLTQSTFGPSPSAIDDMLLKSFESWFQEQLALNATLHLDGVVAAFPNGDFRDSDGKFLNETRRLASNSFWRTAIEADDQLRQRMAFALSQIFVVSDSGDLGKAPASMAGYMDTLTRNAFGNYRDLLEEVTYSPAMAVYLTYLRNRKADPKTGRVPDENYARELMQLFTVGLVQLNIDGSPVIDNSGNAIEIYDNTDITELAKVFTGLSYEGDRFWIPSKDRPVQAFHNPLMMFDEQHSTESKEFLGTLIPENTSGDQSIDMALDTLFNHPNVGPFISRQLIQRFVTSAPAPEYIERVATAFNNGEFQLPYSQTVIGTGERGDLAATIAAILFDEHARNLEIANTTTFGKLREPVLRFTHWARAFEVNSADASNERSLYDTSSPSMLGQHPYRSPSVFNFYRPGYIAVGTETGAAGLTSPELQIFNATSVIGYPNFISSYAFDRSPKKDSSIARTFVANYSSATAIADDASELLDHYDRLLTYGTLADDTRDRIIATLDGIPTDTDEDLLTRARLASVMVMTSPEYLVQR